MANPLIRKLEQFTRLSAENRRALDGLSQSSRRSVAARRDLIREGDRPRVINLVLDGWACRYKTLEDGRRQIMAFFLPGDLCDVHVYILQTMDHSIGALTPLSFVEISRETLEQLVDEHPRVGQALWWESLVTASIQREWTVNLGQRSALERMAHLICELYFRARAVGLVKDGGFFCPLTQTDLADATGMTAVHVNRTVQELRARGLLHWKGKHVEIPDLDALCSTALFNDGYLHLGREGAYLDAND